MVPHVLGFEFFSKSVRRRGFALSSVETLRVSVSTKLTLYQPAVCSNISITICHYCLVFRGVKILSLSYYVGFLNAINSSKSMHYVCRDLFLPKWFETIMPVCLCVCVRANYFFGHFFVMWFSLLIFIAFSIFTFRFVYFFCNLFVCQSSMFDRQILMGTKRINIKLRTAKNNLYKIIFSTPIDITSFHHSLIIKKIFTTYLLRQKYKVLGSITSQCRSQWQTNVWQQFVGHERNQGWNYGGEDMNPK